MEGMQGRTEGSPVRRLPFLETVEHLHQHNLRVAEALVDGYNSKKQIFRKEAVQQEEVRARALEKLEEDRRRSLQAKQKEVKRRNQENIAKIEHYLADKKAGRARKEKELMEGSSVRREAYLQNLAASFHHSQDRRSKVEVKQEGELKRSLLLMERNEEKIRNANDRRTEFLESVKNAARLKNYVECGAAISLSKTKENEKREEELQKLILKYDSSAKHLSEIGNTSGKLLSEKKREEEKNLEKHQKKRSQLQEDIERRREEEARKCSEKMQKVNASREQKVCEIAGRVESKRKQKERNLLYNTFYLNEEAGKKVSSIVHKHYNSQMFLTSIKFQREKLHKQNLHDSFRATIRS